MTAIPILPSRNLDRTADFYRMLGFDRQRRFADYLVTLHPDFEIHFIGNGPNPPIVVAPPITPAACYLRCNDADALHRDWQPLGLPRFSILSDQPWGLREFNFADPDGNLIRVGHVLS